MYGNTEIVQDLEKAVGILRRENPVRHKKFIKESRRKIFYHYNNVSVNGVYLIQNPKNSGMDIGHFVQNMLDRGDLKDYPEKPICSHFGMWDNLGMDSLQMSSRGNHVQFVLSLSSGYGTKRVSKTEVKWRRFSKRIFDLRKRAIKKVTGLKIVETWNGGEGQDSMSFMLNRPCPQSVADGVQGYKDLPDVFDYTESERRRSERFYEWWDETKKRVGIANA